MTITYRAVVKYAVDASDAEKRGALEEGIAECAMELYAEHGLPLDELELIWRTAQSDVQLEEQLHETS